MTSLPAPLAALLERVHAVLRDDGRIVGVAAGGSYLTGEMDEYSDLDLVVAVEPAAMAAVMAEREGLARRMGPLLSAFTGEHVGEPRLLICLYGPDPLLHLDLKFVALEDVPIRVEDPAVLWERDGRMSAALHQGQAVYPQPAPQWIEDRFWVWVHYTAGKIGRGELFEVLDALAFMRARVLGPLALAACRQRPSGVRRLEGLATPYLADLKATLAGHDRDACLRGLRATAALYLKLRPTAAPAQPRSDAESAAMAYLASLERKFDSA